MNTCRLLAVVPIALVMSLAIANVASSQTAVVRISPNSQPDPLVVNGKSGGTVKSNCGNIASAANQVIQLTESLPYLRLTVESSGQPTLLVDGPSGRFCVLADSYSKSKPEISGFWPKGNYSLYVGDLSQGQNPYTLSISQQKK